MAEKEGSDINFVTKLITASKKLTDANICKCEYEQILKEVTLFKNLTNLFYKPSSRVRNILSFNAKLVTEPSLQQLGENLMIIVSNNSSGFNFSPQFWQFSVEYYNGVRREVCTWKLEEPLAKGKSQTFMAKFSPDTDFSPLEVKINVIFTINWKDERFVRVLPIGSLLIDIMYFLSPGRSVGTFSSYGSSPLPLMSDLYIRMRGQERQVPTITMFEFQFDSQLTDLFLNVIFLRDSLHRGFPPDFITVNSQKSSPVKDAGENPVEVVENEDTKVELSAVYVQNEMISISASRNGGSITFKCSNSKILFSLKIAIFHRLLMYDGLKIVCPDDKTCEKLYAIKLKLESKDRNLTESYGDLMELYLELRDVSESVFIKLSSVE